MSKKIKFQLDFGDSYEEHQIYISPSDEPSVIKETILDAAALDSTYLVRLYKPDDLTANISLTYKSLDTAITYIAKLSKKRKIFDDPDKENQPVDTNDRRQEAFINPKMIRLNRAYPNCTVLPIHLDDKPLQHLESINVTKYEYVSKRDIYDLIINKQLSQPIPYVFFSLLQDSEQSNSIICPGNNEHSLGNALIEALKKKYNLNKESSEEDVSKAVQPLLTDTIKGYAEVQKLVSNVSYTTNQIEKTATTTRNAKSQSTKNTKTRRDFICYLDEIPIIIGEEKGSEQDMNKCSEQLEENVGFMSPEYYHKVPFILCYAAAGKYLKFFAYIRRYKDLDGIQKVLERPTFETITADFYDLTKGTDRLEIFRIILNAMQFYHGCKLVFFPTKPCPFNLKKTSRCQELNTFVHLRGEKKTGGLVFVKTFDHFSNYSVANPDSLKQLFKHLQKNQIRHTYRDFKYSEHNDSLVVESKYCQYNSLDFIENKSDVKKMLIHVSEALIDLHAKGFVHRDLRLPNIIYDVTAEVVDVDDEKKTTQGEFLLIDFDHSGKDGEKLLSKHNKHPKHLDKDVPYKIEHDIFTFGALIEDLASEKPDLVDQRILKFVPNLKQNKMSLKDFICELKKLK